MKNEEYKKLASAFNKMNADTSHFVNSNDICTPIECVEEMLNKIPEKFWANKNMKLLDPCAGNGNFHLYVRKKLSQYHTDADIEKMLYFNEINKKRIANIKKYFNNPIITEKDFLSFDDVEKYNIVVANPPYAKFTDGKRAAKNHNMSRDFVLKALEVLKPDGYIVFIIPDNWMSLADRNDVVKSLSQYQFVYLDIHGAKKYFPKVGSSFTWFVLQKKENKNKFKVNNNFLVKSLDNASLDKGTENIPLLFNDIVKSIVNKTLNNKGKKFKIETSSNLHKYTKKNFLSDEKDKTFTHKIRHTPNQTVWASVPHKFQEGWKVFISLTSYYETFVDECGMTQSIAFIQTKNKTDAEIISKVLAHPLYVFLNNIHRYGNFNNIRVLQKFPIPKDFNDIYGSFGISKEEKEYIEKIINK